MPLYTNNPGSSELIFVQPKGGKFLATIDSVQEEFQAIEGTLDMVRVEFDEGNPSARIQPYDAFIMHIRDNVDTNKVYRIKMNIDRNFTFSVAKVLGDIPKGTSIIAKAKAGDDPAVTFCNILKKNEEGEWVRPTQVEMPTDKSKRPAFVKSIVEAHSAYSPKKES